MGDLPAAGRYWFLTERQGDDVAAATVAMYERYGRDAASVRRALPLQRPLTAYPPTIQQRVVELERASGREWSDRGRGAAFRSESLVGRTLVPAIIIALTVGVWCVGVIAVLAFVVRAVT